MSKDNKENEITNSTTPQTQDRTQLKKRVLSGNSIADETKKRKFSDSSTLSFMRKNNIEQKEQKILKYFDEMEKISTLNSNIDSILFSASQGLDGIISGARLIAECKEKGLWDSQKVACKMLEESIANNLEIAKKATILCTLTGNLSTIDDTIDNRVVINKGVENIVLSILINGSPTDEKQKMLVHLELDNIENLPDKLTKRSPLTLDKIPSHVEFIDNLCDLSKSNIDIGNILKPKFQEFITERDKLQEVLAKHAVRIVSHVDEIKEINKLQLTQAALKIDYAINNLKENISNMSVEQIDQLNELENRWKNKKIELINGNKLKDMSKDNEHEFGKVKSFWQTKSKNSELKDRLKSHKQEVKERLKDNKLLNDELNKAFNATKQLNSKVNELKTKNTLKEIDTNIKIHTSKSGVLSIDEKKNIVAKTKVLEKSLTNT